MGFDWKMHRDWISSWGSNPHYRDRRSGAKPPSEYKIYIQKCVNVPEHNTEYILLGKLGAECALTQDILQSLRKEFHTKTFPHDDDLSLPQERPFVDRDDRVCEIDYHNNPFLDHMDKMFLKRDRMVFRLTIEEITDVREDVHYVTFTTNDVTKETKLCIFGKTYNMLMEEYKAHFGKEHVHVWHRDHSFFPRVLKECFVVRSECNIVACQVCGRLFYVTVTEHISVCQDCMETYVGAKCDERVARVMSEVTGHIVGLTTEEEMRSFSTVTCQGDKGDV